jgi:hypothetical protein
MPLVESQESGARSQDAIALNSLPQESPVDSARKQTDENVIRPLQAWLRPFWLWLEQLLMMPRWERWQLPNKLSRRYCNLHDALLMRMPRWERSGLELSRFGCPGRRVRQRSCRGWDAPVRSPKPVTQAEQVRNTRTS